MLSCLLPSRKTLNWCKYPVWMNISWMEVAWLQAEFFCVCVFAPVCLCVLMHACVHTEAQVILRYLNSTHSNKTTGHAGNGNVIGLWQDAVCEQNPVCPTGVVSYTSTLTRAHTSTIITYTYTHTRPPLFLFISHSLQPTYWCEVQMVIFKNTVYFGFGILPYKDNLARQVLWAKGGSIIYVISTMVPCLNYVHNFQFFFEPASARVSAKLQVFIFLS